MIILHNSYDKSSRDFVALHGVGATIFDWYAGGREAFWLAGGTHKVGAFPSVVVDIPTHIVAEFTDTDGVVIPKHAVTRLQTVVRKPQNMGVVQLFLNKINGALQASEAQGLKVEPLTLQNMSDRKA